MIQTTLNEQHWKISIEEKVISQYINFLCCSPLSSDFLCQSEFLHRSEHIRRSIRYWFKQLRKKNFNFRLIISSVVLCCMKKRRIKFKANRVWFITLIVRYMSHIKNHHVSHLAVRADLLHLLSWSSILSSSWQQETMPVASIQNLRSVWVFSHTFLNYVENQSLKLRDSVENKKVESMINNIFISFPCYACHSGDVDELYILALILSLLSIFSVLLFIGVINQSRLFITPWWDYCMLFNRNLLPILADSHSA